MSSARKEDEVGIDSVDRNSGDTAVNRDEGAHLVVCGSPRRMGRSAAIVNRIVEGDCSAKALFISDLSLFGCDGCDACKVALPRFFCAKQDDMVQVYAALDEAACLTVVCPLYFSGPPSQFKALLDRMQPYYWAQTRRAPKRPACLIVVGEGGDPHGADPLVTIVRSALAVAGFSLESIETRIYGRG